MPKKPTYEELEKQVKKLKENDCKIIKHQLSQLERLAKIGTWKIDIQEQHCTLSDGFLHIHGLCKSELPLKDLLLRLHPDDYIRVSAAMNRCLSKSEPYEIEHRIEKKDTGEIRWLRAKGEPVFDKKKQPVQFFGFSQDITESKQKQGALEEREEMYRAFIDETNDLISTVDQDARFIFINHMSKKYFGLSQPDCIGRPAFDFVHPEDRTRTKDWFQTNIKNKETSGTIENRLISQNGEIHHTLWNSNFYYDQDGNLLKVNGIARDISLRKQAEESLSESEKRYHDLFENAPVGIGIIDKNKKLIAFNEAILHPGGYRKKDIDRMKHVTEFFSSETEAEKLITRAKNQGFIDDEEVQLKRKNGTPYYALLNLQPIQIKGRDCWQVMVQDITERKLTEIAIEHSKRQWETTFDAITDWVSIIDKDHNLIRSNKAIENFVGLSPANAPDKVCYALVHASNAPVKGCPLEKSIKSGKRESMELQLADQRWIQVLVDPIKSDSKPDSFVHIVRDITESKKQENELIAARKAEAFSLLAGGISHDYNNILTVIWGNISLMKEEISDPELQKYFNDADLACEQARRLTHQFITLSKASIPSKRSYNINSLMESIINYLSDTREIRISLNIEDHLPDIQVDKDLISIAFKNILNNAVEAMPDGGRLAIEATQVDELPEDRQVGGKIRITFQDSGKGIADALISRVFDPYFSTKEMGSQKGMGLGLSVARSVIIKHGGQITLNSILGKGTTVSVLLPLQEYNVNDDLKSKMEQISESGKPIILLMEDEAALRRTCANIIKRMNFEVITAGHGQEAIEIYESATDFGIKIDLVLLDQNIKGGKDGIETIRELRTLGYKDDVILVTGSPGAPAITDFKQYGFDDVILKPYTKQQFEKVIKKYIK